jgi:hypothetical protein
MNPRNYRVEARNLKKSNDLFAAMPKSLLIYNTANIVQIPDLNRRDDLAEDDFINTFSKSLTATFPIQGEISGYAISTLNDVDEIYLQENQSDIAPLFIEASNILIGNFLTKLDSDYGLFSHCSAPIVHKANINIEKKEAIRKNRILNLLRKSYPQFIVKKFKYDLNFDGNSYPIALYLLVDLKTPHHEE